MTPVYDEVGRQSVY